MGSKREIGIALLGHGYWGSKLRKYVEENENFDMKYVCDSRSNLDEVWGDPDVEAVVVATPMETHYQIVKSALLHGKDVLSEKPLATKSKECYELKDIAENKNLRLLTEYTWTFSKGLNKAKQEVGKIGEIRSMELTHRHLGRFGRYDVYWLLASHMLSILDMFTPLTELEFHRTDLVVDEGRVETGIINFKNDGVKGYITISLNYPSKETKVIIYGTKGTIIYNPLSLPTLSIVEYERPEWIVATKIAQKCLDYDFDESNNLRYAIDYFRKVLIGEAESNIERACKITEILEKL